MPAQRRRTSQTQKGSYLMKDQRTSEKPVSAGQAELFGRMTKDWCLDYEGGRQRLEMAKGHPSIKSRFHELLDELAEENQILTKLMAQAPWTRIRIGTHRSYLETARALQAANVRLGNHEDYLLKHMKFLGRPVEIDLYRATNRQLGLTSEIFSWAQLRRRLERIGFCGCPQEVAPELRLQYLDQPVEEALYIFMVEPVECDDARWTCSLSSTKDYPLLAREWGSPSSRMYNEKEFVFCRRDQLVELGLPT